MARFYVNEREIVPPPGATSFEEILRHVDKAQLPPNSVVRNVNVDGNPILEDNMDKDPAATIRQMEKGDKVEIVTGTVEEIVSDSLREAFAYLERAGEGIPALARRFQADPGPESFRALVQLYEGFYWLNLLLSRLAENYEIVLDDLPVQGAPAAEHNRRFLSVLKQLLDSQEKGDWVLISDLLEYEIAPMVPVWKEMFQMIADKAPAAR
ncbi:MAG: hypothetical protein JW793_15275 [Acidobacteria bacterium]|nr:hypothetical protein [Acidobacteriota bacterium]